MQTPGHINNKTTRAPRGSLKKWRDDPFADYNLALDPLVSDIALDAYDKGMLDIKNFLGGAQATIAGGGSIQTLGTVANNMVQKGTPISSAVLVLHTAFDKENSFYTIMPPRKMQVEELQGFSETELIFGTHLPQEAAEFTTGHYLDYETRQYAAKGFRYIQACRTGADEIHTDYGKQIWAFKILALGNNFRVLSELIILAALLNANDRYGDHKLAFGKSAQSIEDLKKRNRESGGDPSGASILGHRGMFGILHRDKGFEWLLGWVKKIGARNDTNFTHLIIAEGTLELIACSERRTSFLGAGEKAQSNLNAGANLARKEITAKGFTIIEDSPRTVRNASTKTINMLTSAAQVGRWLLLDNTAYWDLASALNSWIPGSSSFSSGNSKGNGGGAGSAPGSFSMPGMGSVNDLYYLNLEGRGTVERQRYAEIQKSALCWDRSSGRLDEDQYNHLLGNLDEMIERLGINMTSEARFSPDPWVVYQNGKYEIVRMIGNQDTKHTSVDDTKSIARYAASRISQLLSGTNCISAINDMLKLMKMNYEVAPVYPQGGVQGTLSDYISSVNNNLDSKGSWDSNVVLPGFSTILHMEALSKMYYILKSRQVIKDQARIARLGMEAMDHYTKVCKQIFCVERRKDDSWSNFYFNPSTLAPWMYNYVTSLGGEYSDERIGDLAFQQNVIDHRKYIVGISSGGDLIDSEVSNKSDLSSRIDNIIKTKDVTNYYNGMQAYLVKVIGQPRFDSFVKNVGNTELRDLYGEIIKQNLNDEQQRKIIAVITLMATDNQNAETRATKASITNLTKSLTSDKRFKAVMEYSDEVIKKIGDDKILSGKFFGKKVDYDVNIAGDGFTLLSFKDVEDGGANITDKSSIYDEFYTNSGSRYGRHKSGCHKWEGKHWDHASGCHGGKKGRRYSKGGLYTGIGVNVRSSMFSKTAPKRSILAGYADFSGDTDGIIDLGYLPNEHFREREKSLTPSEYENWAFAVPFRLLTGAEPTSKLMCELHAHGIPQPMSLIVLDPHINFRMNAMVFCTRGGQQGTSQKQRLNYCLAQSSLTTDNDIREISLSVTTWIMAVVNPRNVLVIPHASFDSYQSGGNGEIVTHIKGVDRNIEIDGNNIKGCWDPRNPTDSTANRFIAYGGGSLRRKDLGDTFSIYGSNSHESLKLFSGVRIPDGVLGSIRDNCMSYPSALLVNIKTGFYMLNDGRVDSALYPENYGSLKDYPQGSRNGCFNGWVCLGNQWQTNVTTGRGSTRKYDGVGPLGKLSPGCGTTFSGEPTYLDNKLGESGVSLSIKHHD